ncbi:two-component system, chemotaxis family, sensor kinase CheA [Singulisphaera sp. GP187]|uniref:hybrid sensor histidine kinase/response regulator n=1 Tax=Singulisphaera sp. GP187 TaxID=1882752 RepID=UPI00092C3E44|nr:hybrid sensor histidine kinase/response regulator [Singulisphaera sp. GP187]SIO40766.1 two-component system, chemotaxis family, sensor kinase CheA [Singulisphaera sp. GP187]
MEAHADQFVIQAREHLAVLEQTLLSLENPGGPEERRERIDRGFRIVHSLKGDAGFLGYSSVRTLANAMETVLEALRSDAIPVSPLAIERLLVARDHLATLVDDLGNSHAADLSEILAQLERLEDAPLQGSQAWEIDLRQLDRECSGRIAGFFAAFERCGAVSAPRIEMGLEDVTGDFARGPIHFRARLKTALQAEDIRRALGLSADAMNVHQDRSLPLSVDLAEWMRASQRPLATLLAELDRLGGVEDPVLEFAASDLAVGPPVGPVRLRGKLRTALAQREVEQRLRFPVENQQVQSPSVAIATPDLAATPLVPPSESALATVEGLGSASRVHGQEPDKTASLRISVELLDRLMTLTGELTLIRNQSLLAFDPDDGLLRPIVQRLDAVTSSLQETVLRTRMQPVGNLFGKFPRVVRDLARQLGKQVEMTVVGRDVELDKTILEQLSDPLTHLVRNSVDHGIESPAERVANGKPAAGQITLTAAHEDGQVRIEIRDDGRGIDPQAVRAKALAMRLNTEAELDRMSTRELLALILLPGFSTARQVTEVSGRGVGMDVVKTNIEHLEGSLTIDSQFGAGTAMILRMPLTLAIIPCLILTVNGERYAIPQRELEEAVCLHPGMTGRIEQAYDTEVYRLRDRILPVVRLRDVLSRPHPFTAEDKAEILKEHAANADPARIEYILVLRLPGRRFGLVVDEVRGTEEIVVKPMHASIKRVGIFTGATIMGDGRVALITDVAGIVEHARLSFEAALESEKKAASARESTQSHRVLLFAYGPHEQFALPLLQIRRIEMIGRDRLDRVGDHEYVTVDGKSLRVLRLDKVINVSAPEPALAESSSQMALILPKFVSQPMAILVSRIVDMESLAVDLQEHPEQDEGILGSAIVRDRLTLFLDLHRLMQKLFNKSVKVVGNPAAATSTQRPSRLLLVDDTPFFREVVKRYLVADGHYVETAVNGEDALSLLATGREFDLIVSDIEMPIMDGWEFAREVRRRGVKTPMLALTSLSGIPYEVKAKECGFDSYEVKLDHDRLVRKVGNLLIAQSSLT